MLRSELIKKLQDDIATSGDIHVLSYRIVDDIGGSSGAIYSHVRMDKKGRRLVMTLAEYKVFLEREAAKK